ncbi:glucokinase [Scopulibacillus darangshiensis]|uniref:Glucokinase n=1 Tax=Scopulibacillus darangshiensis TaxID=442528 RepID=A0A4R2NLC8_9BACL|nr:ROK family protein [Scopulibacillus darangshiensis]TCP22331.1 glucokinase [Scopulibacillus darangshiensis]
MTHVLAADIGGTKIAAALAHEKAGFTARTQVESAAHDSEALFESLLSAFSNVLDEADTPQNDIQHIGIGVPGKVDPVKGLAVYQNNLSWRHFPLVSRLKEVFPKADIAIENDVYMAAYGEWQARRLMQETFVYLTVSTGISACIIHEGRFIRGAGMAGEIGFTVLNHEDEVKTLENLASGPAIEKEASRTFDNTALTTRQVMDQYKNNDPRASAIIGNAAGHIARGLHQIISVIDPHVIVLGGGVMNNQPQFVELVKEKMTPLIQNPIQNDALERIWPSHYKGDAGLQGAVWYTLRNNEKQDLIERQ